MRPYKGLLVSLYYNGRTTVRPYKGLLVSLYYNGRTTVRPYKGLFVSSSHVIGYSSRFDRDGRTDRASLQDSVTASGVRGVR